MRIESAVPNWGCKTLKIRIGMWRIDVSWRVPYSILRVHRLHSVWNHERCGWYVSSRVIDVAIYNSSRVENPGWPVILVGMKGV